MIDVRLVLLPPTSNQLQNLDNCVTDNVKLVLQAVLKLSSVTHCYNSIYNPVIEIAIWQK